MREWRRGSAVTINAADRLMVELGEHLGDLPDDVWTDPPDRRPMRTQPVTTAQRLEAVARVRAGAAISRIAGEYRVGRHTLLPLVADLSVKDFRRRCGIGTDSVRPAWLDGGMRRTAKPRAPSQTLDVAWLGALTTHLPKGGS